MREGWVHVVWENTIDHTYPICVSVMVGDKSKKVQRAI